MSESSASDFDICIAGGGMVGLALARLLVGQNAQWRIALVENHPLQSEKEAFQPSFDSRSTALAPGSVNILKKIQLWDAIQSGAQAITEVQVSDRGHLGWARQRASDEGLPALGYVVDNRWLGRCLTQSIENLPGLQCIAPAALQAVQMKADGAHIHVRSGDSERSLRCSLLVLADGAQSPLARSLGIAFKIRDYRQRAIVANVEHSEAHAGRAFERFTQDGPLALLPLPSDGTKQRSALVWTRAEGEAAQHLLEASAEAFLAELQKQFGHALGRFTRLGERKHHALQRCFAQEQLRRSLVLMGNAAHFLHPVAGQGFNLALRDCAELTATLAQAAREAKSLGDLTVLETYQQARDRDQWLTTLLGDTFIATFDSRQPLAQIARNLGLLGLNQRSPLKSLFFEQMMGLGTRAAQL